MRSSVSRRRVTRFTTEGSCPRVTFRKDPIRFITGQLGSVVERRAGHLTQKDASERPNTFAAVRVDASGNTDIGAREPARRGSRTGDVTRGARPQPQPPVAAAHVMQLSRLVVRLLPEEPARKRCCPLARAGSRCRRCSLARWPRNPDAHRWCDRPRAIRVHQAQGVASLAPMITDAVLLPNAEAKLQSERTIVRATCVQFHGRWVSFSVRQRCGATER
jgi:hypothetical protein